MNAMTTNGTKLHPMLLLALALAWVLVSASSSLAMEASAPVYDPCWDTECGPCEVCQGGECFDTPDHTVCMETLELAQTCEASGGIWDACGQTSYTRCSDCIPSCVCPAGQTLDAEGCRDCEGGECVNPSTYEELCANTGGTNQCVSNCPPGESCAAICMLVCACPTDLYWDDLRGCVAPPDMHTRCPNTGGEMGCEPGCSDGDEDCHALTVCNDWCYCPEGQAYDPLCGCVDAPVVESEVYEGPMCSQSGMGGMGGCTGGGSGAPDSALMLCLCFAMALSRRRVSPRG